MTIVLSYNLWCQGILAVKYSEWFDPLLSMSGSQILRPEASVTAEIRWSLMVAQTQEGSSYFHPVGMAGVVFLIGVGKMIH